jgi:hypothetical protein
VEQSKSSSRRLGYEAVVIVGSILLAFAIDRAYEGFQERSEETVLLSGLETELTTSREALLAHMSWYDRWESAITGTHTYLQAQLSGTATVAPEVVAALRTLYASPTFDPSTATLDIIESSGRGRAIMDRELRTLIAEWRVHASDAFDQQRTLQRSREEVIWPLLRALKLHAPNSRGAVVVYEEPPTVDQLLDLDVSVTLSFYGMLAQISRDDWLQVLDATDAILARLNAMGI